MAGYLCVAENKVGTVEKLFSLTVQGKKKYYSQSILKSECDRIDPTAVFSFSASENNWPEGRRG